MKTKRLGEILVDSNLLTEEQLRQALRIQENQGGKLGEILVHLDLVDEGTIADIVSEQRDFKRVELDPQKTDKRLLSIVPRDVCRKYRIIPYQVENDRLILAMDDPLNKFAIDIVEFITNFKVTPGIAEPSRIEELLDEIYGEPEEKKKAKAPSARVAEKADSGIPTLTCDPDSVMDDIDRITSTAMKERATDVHFDSAHGLSRVRFRINGVLADKFNIPEKNHEKAISRLKILANLDEDRSDLEQTGAFSIKRHDRNIIFKAHFVPTITGTNSVIELVDETEPKRGLEQLGLTPHELAVVIENIFKPGGMVLICGPGDVGKTTLLYAILKKLSSKEKKIFTLERQPEETLSFASQVKIEFNKGMNYSVVLSNILKMDPDIIMIDEITDSQTAQNAMRAAYSGKTLISSLYTRDTFEGVIRLMDYGIDPFVIADSLNVAISPRLIRTLCQSCREQSKLNDGRIVYRPRACDHCGHTGYSDRTGIFEIIPGHDLTREILDSASTVESLATTLHEKGINSLWQKAVKKVLAGDTSLTEIVRAIPKMPWD